MMAKLLKRLAGRRTSASGDIETLAGHNRGLVRREKSGPVGNPLPSAWVKMHVWRRDHGRCVLCGGQERVWFDYIVPPWEGGTSTEQNMRLMCERCNPRNKGVSIRRRKLGA
jgi:HNH endonuclease